VVSTLRKGLASTRTSMERPRRFTAATTSSPASAVSANV
jgi:hypothetical protein